MKCSYHPTCSQEAYGSTKAIWEPVWYLLMLIKTKYFNWSLENIPIYVWLWKFQMILFYIQLKTIGPNKCWRTSNKHHSEHFNWPHWPSLTCQVLVNSRSFWQFSNSNHISKIFRILLRLPSTETLVWHHHHLDIRMHVDWHDVMNTEFSLLQTFVLPSITIHTRCKNICLQLNTFKMNISSLWLVTLYEI